MARPQRCGRPMPHPAEASGTYIRCARLDSRRFGAFVQARALVTMDVPPIISNGAGLPSPQHMAWIFLVCPVPNLIGMGWGSIGETIEGVGTASDWFA